MNSNREQIDLAREEAFTLGSMRVQPATREVLAGGERETLEPRVMQVLVALARSRGEVVSRDDLIMSCWAGRVVGDDAINRCIGQLRRLSEARGGFTLDTVPRVGYRLVEAERSASEAAAAPGEPAETPRTPHPGRIPRLAVLAAAVVLVAGAVWGLSGWLFRPGPAPASEKALVVRAPVRPTIAVLPLTPLYREAGAQQLGDSIALRMADALSSSTFDVISPARSFEFRGPAKADASRALGADFLIDGDLQRTNGDIAATVRLIQTSNGTTVFVATLRRPVAEAGDLPDQIGTQIAALGTLATKGLNPKTPWTPDIIAGYVKATYQYWIRNDPFSAYETARAIAQKAPDDAYAQATLGFMAAYLAAELPVDRQAAMITEARAAAARAIRLDPGYGDSRVILAITTPSFEWTTRERHLRDGIKAFPDAEYAQTYLIELLQNAGRFHESAPMAEHLYARKPNETRSLIELINARLWLDQLTEVRPLIAQGIKLYPTNPWFPAKLFEATAFHGAVAEAEALLRDPDKGSVLEPVGIPKTFTKIVRALRSRRAPDIAAVVSDCAEVGTRSPDVKRTCLIALTVLGRIDDAFRLADVLYPDQRDTTPAARQRTRLSSTMAPTAYLTIGATAPLRADPRYRDVVERVGLLQYWKTSRRPPDFCGFEKVPVCRLLNS